MLAAKATMLAAFAFQDILWILSIKVCRTTRWSISFAKVSGLPNSADGWRKANDFKRSSNGSIGDLQQFSAEFFHSAAIPANNRSQRNLADRRNFLERELAVQMLHDRLPLVRRQPLDECYHLREKLSVLNHRRRSWGGVKHK